MSVDVDSQIAVRIDLRDAVFRAWTGRGPLMLDETTTIEEGAAAEVGSFGASFNVRGLEFFGSDLWACSWSPSGSHVYSVNTGTAALTAVGTSGSLAPNSLFEFDGQRYLVDTAASVATLSNAGVVGTRESVTGLPSRSRIEAAVEVGGVLYAYVLERGPGTRAVYSLAKSGATWTPTRIADLGTDQVRGVAKDGQRVLGYSRRAGVGFVVELTPATGAVRDVWEVPDSVSPMFGLAVSPDGVVYGAAQRTLYRLTLPGSSSASNAYLDADATGLAEATLPNVTEDGGVGRATVVVASDDARWNRPQGPVAVELREVTRAPGGAWTASPLVFRYVLGESTYQAGVWRATAIPVAQSARHRANLPEWSSLNQLDRTGGADTSFSRLRSTGRALPFPVRLNR